MNKKETYNTPDQNDARQVSLSTLPRIFWI